ncbi:hypothetical protein [Paludisphaera sp.]|uniref:hypothetical protein n=1 Tax=Paludisphaera sp. TaxID=2017432 RepID=UPI00301C1FC4
MIRKRTTAPRPTIRTTAALALVLALAASGCGTSGPPADPEYGRKALVTALDAWQAGATPASLAQATPPIHVADGDWNAGAKLQGYKADDEGKHFGADLNYRVVLELKPARGKATRRDAVYAVSTHPRLMVLRQDD